MTGSRFLAVPSAPSCGWWRFPARTVLGGIAFACALMAQLVPASFPIPEPFSSAAYKLVPLGPDIAQMDYDAYMSSIDHIRATMGGNWPRPDLTMEDQAKDMAGEKSQWDTRQSFPYAVLTRDGSKEIGCFYLRPSNRQGYDAVATFWTTKSAHDSELDQKLYTDMKAWTAKAWPFRKIAWLGREITQAEWKALPKRDEPAQP